jgi:hypothetical protein
VTQEAHLSTAFPSTKHTTQGKTLTPSLVVKKGAFSTFALRNKVCRCLSASVYIVRLTRRYRVVDIAIWQQVQTHVQVFIHDRTSSEIPVEKVDQAVPLLSYITT